MSEADQEPGRGGAEPDRSGPGGRLTEAREAHGLSVQAAAESLGASAYVLEALEANDWQRLEAPVYVRGYLRKYARLLGLEENEIVAAYERSASPHDPAVRAHATTGFPRRNSTRWLAPATIGIVVIIVVLMAIWGWHRLHRRAGTAQIPTAAPSATMAVTQGAPLQASTGASLPVAGTRPVPSGAGQSPSSLHLELKVNSPSWIEVYGPDHDRLYYNLAAAGDTLTFDRARGPFTVFIGNADGVRVLLNGKPVVIPAADRSGKTARMTLGSPQAAPPGSTS